MPYRVTQTETPQKPYIHMFYRSPNEFSIARYPSKELYNRSKVFALENRLDHRYSMQEFGQGITRLIGKYKKRTSLGYIYELCMNINEFNKLLSDYESSITKYYENFRKEWGFKTSKLLDKLLSEYISSATDSEKKKILTTKKARDRARRCCAERKTREARTKASKLYEFWLILIDYI